MVGTIDDFIRDQPLLSRSALAQARNIVALPARPAKSITAIFNQTNNHTQVEAVGNFETHTVPRCRKRLDSSDYVLCHNRERSGLEMFWWT